MTDWDKYPDLLRALADDIEKRQRNKKKNLKPDQTDADKCVYVASKSSGIDRYSRCAGIYEHSPWCPG